MKKDHPILETRNLVKTFHTGSVTTPVLKGIDFSVECGEWVAIMGRSGAGKSTFMYQMSLLDDPTSGEVIIDGTKAHSMSERDKMRMRLSKFGYVFQDYALMPELTASENIIVPLLMEKMDMAKANQVAERALTDVGLEHRMGNLPSQMSGGEQQRVSIARAVAERPEILFADEPTANLDSESAMVVMDVFVELHKKGQTIVMVTHEKQYAQFAERIVTIDDGKIVKDERVDNPKGR